VKPLSLLVVLLGALAVFFHYLFYGPKRPQPEPPIREEE
jgi:hypothetical protein